MAAVALTAGTADAAAGPLEDRGGPVSVRIGLVGRDPAGLAALARAVSTPGNAQYGRILTPEQARARFGTTGEQVAAVQRWLGAAGMRVTSRGAHWIDATGSASAVHKALGSDMRARSLTLPTDVRTAVASVAQIGAAGPHGMREGATAAAAERSAWTTGTAGSTVAGVATGTTTITVAGVATSTATITVASSATSTADSTAASTTTNAAPANPKTDTSAAKCSPTWGTLPADPKLPPGYSSPEPLGVCGYVPAQLRTAYGITASRLTGKGVTVAVVDAYGSPTMRADADRFAREHGDAPFAGGQYRETVTPDKWTHLTDDNCQTPSDWAGEQALDVETVHGMAPGVTVHYFGANSCADEDINATMAQIVDTHAADIVSASFGETMHRTSGDIDPAMVAQATQLFEYGAVEGIGFYYATGDCGNDTARSGPSCDAESARAQTEWPVSSPWVTGVGGTALALGDRGRPLWEASMGDRRSVLSGDGRSWVPFPGAFYFGGGGGTSEDFPQPYYQRGVVPDRLARTLGTGSAAPGRMRTLPDVAMDGDLMTAVQVGRTDAASGRYSEIPVGGTSASTPMFAAVQADAQQALVASRGTVIGFANPMIYQHASRRAFTDILAHPDGAPADISAVIDLGRGAKGERRVRLFELGHDEGLPAAAGYDLATGLGSPRAEYLDSFRR
ncbi:MAG: protease pro-enzyme activation domain-containing protein [Catenulispora sp.]